MIDKKEFLLQSIIKAYIEHLEPIGSKELKSMYDLEYSTATIRGYFKKLGDEGFLAQEHISSGRTPTNEALKQYWIGRLNFNLQGINIKALEHFTKNVGLTVFLKKEKQDILQNIINVESRYIILEFTSFAVSIKYSQALYKFLSDFLENSLEEILKISKDVGAYELYNSINQSLQSDFEIFNYKEFLSLVLNYDFDEFTINRFLKGNIMEELKEGLYFDGLLPQNYIGICKFCKINNEDYKMFIVGELSKDYEYFFEQITNF
ncbi:Heat-inducible transcription repressor HrcA [Aliarcobacter thereius]|uniref:Heat-inducible transcription repressor HrcA n=1 Tax=Aliarcobacter thereius TaxID=544718 RepID=A0A1C0B8K3_9BACT|nr:heat-shock protein [Aliarcobacter thereius]OCL93762.1 Heat-inducible transcription repressor HrcA [Aliarcobacter thereius]OCL99935.1 Heat-inducible transcription repressor HrcA [Aliarcobacter thereius]TLS73307.1 heat-shock protein [Aliarcobacter thereius]TLT08717.1 heat-shock protein [Aliarcobacter thereius]